jgi:hypothetical protein
MLITTGKTENSSGQPGLIKYEMNRHKREYLKPCFASIYLNCRFYSGGYWSFSRIMTSLSMDKTAMHGAFLEEGYRKRIQCPPLSA